MRSGAGAVRSLPDLALDRPVAAVVVLVSVMVLGVVAAFRLPLDFMPAVVRPMVEVEVPFPGSHPLESLREVAKPVEEEVATIPGARSIESSASSGSASVRVEFDWGDDIEVKRLEVREAVERARDLLPEGIGHIRVQSWSDGPAGGAILEGRISAERDLSESWELLDRRIGRPLERISGVARVDLYGVERPQVRLDLDLDALRRHRLSAAEVVAAVEGANRDVDAGALRGVGVRYDVRALTRFASPAEVAALRLSRPGLVVGDVAAVAQRQPRLEYGRHLDRAFAVGIDVYKEPSANTVATVDRLTERIRAITADPQLEGIRMLVWNNAGESIRSALSGLRDSGLLGGVLAAVVLFLFLRRVTTTAIVTVAIPFSLLATCGAMLALGAQLDVLTLLGLMLGVGMLVDNGVVVVENIHRLEGLGVPPAEAARVGAREVALAVTASTATTVAVWGWLFVSERNTMVIYMGSVALTICLSVAASLLVSLTFIPLAARRFPPRGPTRPGFLLGRLAPAYRRLLGWTLRHRLKTLACLLLLASSAAWPLARLEKTSEPRMQTRDVPIFFRAHDAVTTEAMERHVDAVEAWLASRRQELGYESVYSFYGEGGFASTRVYLPAVGADAEAVARLRGQLRQGLPTLAGVSLEVGDRDMWRFQGGQDRRIVSVALHGEDPEYLEELATAAEDRLRGLADVVEVWGPTLRGERELRLLVDAERARSLGVEPRRVAEAVSFAFRGRQLSRLQGEEGEVEMILGLPEEARPGIDALADLPIPRDDGETVPLASVARVSQARTPERIEREQRRTTSTVAVHFRKEAVTTDEAQERVRRAMAGIRLPEGYAWDFGRWGRERDEGLATMTRGVALSLLIVVLLMAALFESLVHPFAIVVTLPLAFFGAFWGLYLGGFELDSVAFMGVVILIGVVVNNGIVLVDHVNTLRLRGLGRQEALVQGCGDRLRPILMTAITTIFGLLPLALSRATVATAYVDSIAVAVMGGLTTSTLFTLLALPVWYTAVEDLLLAAGRWWPRRARNVAPAAGPLG